MRLLRVEFANLGPFRGEHAIDFASLASQLFLIDGPTGAGKSTIIDAIVFALYDRVAGDASDGARLRSLAAGPRDETFVELEFAVQDRQYKIRRSPAYERAALRGDKVTMNKPSVALYQMIGDTWELKENKAQAVAIAIKDIIGLDREQFVQTVVLPQGEFAKFLLATSAERKPILQRIFTTSGYDVIEAKFAALAEAATLARESAQEAYAIAVAKSEGGVGDVDLDELRSLVASLTHETSQALERSEAAELVVTHARKREAALLELERTQSVLALAQAAYLDAPKVVDGRTVAMVDAEREAVRAQRRELDALRAGEAAQLERRAESEALTRENEILNHALLALLANAHALAVGADQELAATRARELGNRAAELATELRDGAACPVCGSHEHPTPAVHEHGDTDVFLASEYAARAQTFVESVLELVGDVVVDEAVPVADLATAERERKGLIRRREQLDQRRISLEVQERAWQTQRASFTIGEVQEDALEVTLAKLTAELEAIGVHAQLRADVEHAKQAFEVAGANPNLQLEAPDVNIALVRSRDAAGEHARRATELGAAQDQLRRAVTLLRDVEQAKANLEAVEAQTSATIRVAQVVAGRGENKLAQPLSVFVLQSMFDDVIDAANARLAGMLDGRYELHPVEESGDRRRANAGLDLTVVDHAVADDPQRGSRTLSGGETFCVSLALALGLADTVHAYAGGVAIDTLFIDEGFGSLDATTLEDVMAELHRLGEDGRVVGVISHVDAMKSISERIDVTSGDFGSRLSVTWG